MKYSDWQVQKTRDVDLQSKNDIELIKSLFQVLQL